MKIYYPILLLLFWGCGADEPDATLQDHIDNNPSLTAFNELVACAAGGQMDFLEDETLPLNIFLYPELDATTFRYYETEDADADPLDLSLFHTIDTEREPIFDGFLLRYPRPKPDNDVWARVSFINGDTLWYSKAIKLKTNDQPTDFSPDFCDVDLSQPLEPIFTWTESEQGENTIFFHVISDDEDRALSGTYTEERRFQYYNLDNVVFNVTRAGQQQPLELGRSYTFTLMGVSSDNWVNFIAQKSFIPQ